MHAAPLPRWHTYPFRFNEETFGSDKDAALHASGPIFLGAWVIGLGGLLPSRPPAQAAVKCCYAVCSRLQLWKLKSSEDIYDGEMIIPCRRAGYIYAIHYELNHYGSSVTTITIFREQNMIIVWTEQLLVRVFVMRHRGCMTFFLILLLLRFMGQRRTDTNLYASFMRSMSFS